MALFRHSLTFAWKNDERLQGCDCQSSPSFPNDNAEFRTKRSNPGAASLRTVEACIGEGAPCPPEFPVGLELKSQIFLLAILSQLGMIKQCSGGFFFDKNISRANSLK